MSRRNWLHIAALGGCLALALGGLAAGQPSTQGKAQQPTAYQRQPPAPAPTPNLAADQPGAYRPSCEQPQTREDASFCEERRANRIAGRNFWLGVAGTLAVLGSLAFTGWAAVAAARAARAAELSLDHSDEVMRHDLRAYVYAKEAHVQWFSEGIEVVVVVANDGATPATFFSLSGGGALVFGDDRASAVEVAWDDSQAPAWATLGANDTTTAAFRVPGITQREFRASKCLVAKGRIRYGTTFGEIAVTEFAFHAKAGEREGGKMQRSTGKLRAFEIESRM